MANKNFQKKKIEETKGSGFGQYQEGVGGGGSPQARDPNKRAPGVNSDYRQENNDTNQPRTDDGKFTYKSVNGKSIDPKYGPSRGKTVNPLLTGGENGVKIDDVEQEFASQSGSYWNKYKDKWYQKGGEIVTTDLKTRVAADTIWNVAKRRYDSVKGEFEQESTVFSETKKGRAGKEEQAAKQKVQSTGEEQAVINTGTGGIKLKPGTVVPQPLPKAPQPSPSAGTSGGATPVIPSGGQQPGQQPQPQPQSGVNATASASNTAGSLIHSAAQLQQARDLLTNAGVDLTGVTDEQLDAIVDDYIDFNATTSGEEGGEGEGGDEENKVETETETETVEEDSEATKKIKNMGFSDNGK